MTTKRNKKNPPFVASDTSFYTVFKLSSSSLTLSLLTGPTSTTNEIKTKRYVEFKEQDVLKFGISCREYALI